MVNALVLVDEKEKYWSNLLTRECPNCKTEGELLTILSGTTNTLSDAVLVHKHCVGNGLNKILVVTDPYHTRHASLVFNRQFSRKWHRCDNGQFRGQSKKIIPG